MTTSTTSLAAPVKTAPAGTRLFGFPNPVNEKAARVVAAGVLGATITILVLSLAVDHRWLWAVFALAYGFLARFLTGPTLSPLGQVATRIVAPRLGTPRPVPGPPKRFAQAIGAVVTGSASLLVALGHDGTAELLLAGMIVAAGLEALAGYCLGCKAFAALMRAGVIPAETCEACANVSLRLS